MFDLKKFKLPVGFRGRSALVVQFWWLVEFFLFRPSPQFMYKWRVFLLRIFGAKIGVGVLVRPTARITYPWKVEIGNYSWIGDDVVLYSLGPIIIGSNTVISQRSYICTGSHDYLKSTFDIYYKEVKIGNSVWLATDVFVAPGVELGDRIVVGARSSVFSNLSSGFVYKGSPATLVRAISYSNEK